jgi:Undecaprenyl-phosphate glucose phosphotransferase
MSLLGEIFSWSSQKRQNRIYPFSSSIITGCLVLVESVSIILIGLVMQTFLIGWPADVAEYYVSATMFIFLSTIMLLNFAGQYQFDALMKPVENIDKIIVACITAFFLLLAIAFSFKVSDTYSRKWMYIFAFSSTFAIVSYRIVGSWILIHLSRRGILARNIVVLGAGPQAERFLKRVRQDNPPFMSVLGVFDVEGSKSGLLEGYPVHGSLDDLVEFVRNHDVDDIVVAHPWNDEDRLIPLVERLLELPTTIYMASDLIGFRFNLRPPDNNFAPLPVSEIVEKPLSGWAFVAKFLEDRILASVFLIVLSPLFLLTAIAIKIDSPGPVFYRQSRLGFNNRSFSIYKFRSMRISQPASDTTPQATANDPRVTRVGHFIRRTSIDELPQLLNVLNGTMSLVGPRPHAVDHNEDYSKRIRGYFARHRVKPGITGWAQANGLRGETEDLAKMEARVRHDIYYAQNWSLLFDMQILLMTALIVIRGKNAY